MKLFTATFALLALPLAVSGESVLAPVDTIVGIYSQPNLNGVNGVEDCGTENDNLKSIVDHLVKTEGATGGAFNGFKSRDDITTLADPDLEAKIDAYTFFFIPDQEATLDGFDSRSIGIINDYVKKGGNLVMTGTAGGADAIFLNRVFGWDTVSTGCSTMNVDTETSAGTPWAGGASLDCPSATDHLSCGSQDCMPIWGTKTSAAVAIFPYKKGRVIYLGWDYYNSGYYSTKECGYARNTWVTEAFRGALLYAQAKALGIPMKVGANTAAQAVAVTRNSASIGAKAHGDPHFETWGGEKYDFHGECDLVLMSNDDFNDGLGLTVHIRTKIHSWWSSIQSAAISFGEHTLEISGDEKGDNKILYRLDGAEAVDLETGHAALGDYHVKFLRLSDHQSQTRVDLGNGNALSIESWKHFVRVNVGVKDPSKFNGTYGMLGNFPVGQMMGRDGVTVFSDPNEFGEEWRVVATEPKLFSTESGYPLKCLMPNHAQTTLRRLGESLITEEDAALACANVSEYDRDQCIFDVMATNDKDMAGSY